MDNQNQSQRMIESESPRKWQYTWETQSHIPILKLFLFTPNFNPVTHCKNLNIELKFEKSIIQVAWIEQQSCTLKASSLLVVPIPSILVDLESPLSVRSLDDHIEVKIALLLPIDHPIVSSFISELNSDEKIGSLSVGSDCLRPLEMDSDVKTFDAGEVEFFCRNCAFKLSGRPIRSFVDMPSFNWREAADNWFGSCCCSFGGISEKLVGKYVKSYTCTEGTALLTTTSVILSKDDLIGSQVSDFVSSQKSNISNLCDSIHNSSEHVRSIYSANESQVEHDSAKPNTLKLEIECSIAGKEHEMIVESGTNSSFESPEIDSNDASMNKCCLEHSSENKEADGSVDLLANQKLFLDGYLGNIFMFSSSTLSKEIKWVEFTCPRCSHFLGAYPCTDGYGPLDGGIRLLKCYISSSLPVGSSSDLFKKYTVERMFTNHILGSAKDELSFRTVVKDLKTKLPLFQVVLLNPNCWCCTGYTEEGALEGTQKINLLPVAKVLFSDFHDNAYCGIRPMQDKKCKIEVEEAFMFLHPIEDLVRLFKSRNSIFPHSFSSEKGFVLTSVPR